MSYKALKNIMEKLNISSKEVIEECDSIDVPNKIERIKSIIASKQKPIEEEYDDSVIFEDEFHIREPEEDTKEILFGGDEEDFENMPIDDEIPSTDVSDDGMEVPNVYEEEGSGESIPNFIEEEDIPSEEVIDEPLENEPVPYNDEVEVEKEKSQSASEFTFEELEDLFKSLTITEKMSLIEMLQIEVDDSEETEVLDEASSNDFPPQLKKEIEISGYNDEDGKDITDENLYAIKEDRVDYILLARNVSEENRDSVIRNFNENKLGMGNIGYVMTRPGSYIESDGKRLHISKKFTSKLSVNGKVYEINNFVKASGNSYKDIVFDVVDEEGNKEEINATKSNAKIIYNGKEYDINYIDSFNDVPKSDILGVVIPEEGNQYDFKTNAPEKKPRKDPDYVLYRYDTKEEKRSVSTTSVKGFISMFTDLSPEEMFDIYIIKNQDNELVPDSDKEKESDEFVPKHKKKKVEDSLDQSTEERIIERAAQLIADRLV